MARPSSSELDRLIRLLPGYDPHRDAAGCWFDHDTAATVIDFIETCCRHIEGSLAGKPLHLEDWQRAVVANLFGWKRTDDQGREVRRYRECLLYVPRKNGKTPLAAAIANAVYWLDDELGQQDYIAAASIEQADFAYRWTLGMIEAEPEMERRCKPYKTRRVIERADVGSYLKVISADAHTKHGGNSHLILVDELHAQPTRDLVDVLTTSMASQNRKQPLIVYMTTADYERPSICNEKHDYACKVRDGVLADPAFLPVIYETAVDADWKDEAVWRNANPNLGVSVSLDYMRRECLKAQETPAFENEFKRLHLNMRTEQATRWLSMDEWDKCGAAFDESALAGRPCWVGIDLSSVADLTAAIAVFPPAADDDNWRLLCRFWLPQHCGGKRQQRIKEHLQGWANSGDLILTPGNVVDYDAVAQQLCEWRDLYDLREVDCDPYNATQFQTQLVSVHGFAPEQVVSVRQGVSLSDACKEIERLIKQHKLLHGGQQVMRWNASNVVMTTDKRGNYWPDKAKSSEKIDGITALATGMSRAMVNMTGPSAYDDYDPAEEDAVFI